MASNPTVPNIGGGPASLAQRSPILRGISKLAAHRPRPTRAREASPGTGAPAVAAAAEALTPAVTPLAPPSAAAALQALAPAHAPAVAAPVPATAAVAVAPAPATVAAATAAPPATARKRPALSLELRRPAATTRQCLIGAAGTALLIGACAVLHPASGAALTSGAVAPGAGHIFGTDAQGQDVAAQLLAAGRAELPIAFEAALALAASGLLLALAAATNRRDAKAGVALLNLLASLPGLLIGIALIAVAGATSGIVALAVALPFAPGCWRRLLQTARALVDSPFAAAARAMGTSPRRLARQLAASLLAPALAELSLLVARILIAFTLLSFLGFSLPGAASIGALIAQAHAAHAWWLALFPAGALLLACAVLYLLSLGLRALGPQRVDG